MPYKTILVCYTNEESAEQLTKSARALASRYDAHLIGVHTLQAMEVYPGIAMHITSDVTAHFNEAQAKQGEAIASIFKRLTNNQDFVAEWRLVQGRGTHIGEQLAEYARCADLVIMGQPNPVAERPDQHNVQRSVIEGSGRPVLVIPKEGTFETFGASAVIGWSATREATRALHDAVDLLLPDGHATLVWVKAWLSSGALIHDSVKDAAAMLDRHGVAATVKGVDSSGDAIGKVLLDQAFELGADMIVTGAYGHSRVYDFVLGTTTSHLMDNMNLPILFSN